MLIIYWLSDGHIAHVVTNYTTLEEFNPTRAQEMGAMFGTIHVPQINDFVLNRYIDFKVDLQTKQLVYIGANNPFKTLEEV